MPKSGMLFSVIFISSAISALTPEIHDMEAISGAATGDNTTETEVPKNCQVIVWFKLKSTQQTYFYLANYFLNFLAEKIFLRHCFQV
jgi:hypothetical protein